MTIVNHILKQMPALGQPQRKFLETLFATMLVLRGKVNYRNLSRYCGYSEKTISRQFRDEFDWPAFHQEVIKSALDPASELMLAQDASFVPKSGKKTHGLGHFFNGCHSRPERGLEISTLAVVDVTRRSAFTLAVAQTPPGTNQKADADKKKDTDKKKVTNRKKLTDRKKDDPAENRMAFYRQQLRDHSELIPPGIRYLGVDGAYANKAYVDDARNLNLHPITRLRCDANCKFPYTGPHPKRRGARSKYDGKVNWQDLSRFEYLGTLPDEDKVHLYTSVVWHVTLKRWMRVVVLLNCRDPKDKRYVILGSTDLELGGRKLVELYGARFQIEFIFRDSKQFTGLTDCQARDEAALDFHFNASMATLNLVRAAELGAQVEPGPVVISMASWKQRKFNEHLLNLFIEKLALDPSWAKNHPAYEELKGYGAIAA